MKAGIEKAPHSTAARAARLAQRLAQILLFLVWVASWGQSASAATSTNKMKAPTRPDNGAIAFHGPSGSFGYAVDQRTSRDARVAALRQCSDPDCEVVLTLKNSCGALANYRQTYFASRGATRQEAELKARRQCGPKCEILVWACTK